MDEEAIKEKIKNLFNQKKYKELIYIAEQNFTKNQRSPGLINLIGVAKFYKEDVTREDIQESLLCFEEAFLKGKGTIHAYNGLLNLIKLGIKASILFSDFSNFLQKATKYYEESEANYERDQSFLANGIELFTFLLDHEKIKKIIKKILNSDIDSKFLNGLAIFGCNYYYDWKQIDYLKNSKKNAKLFSKLNIQDLKNISYKDNIKIKLGFVSCDLEKNHSTIFFLKNTIKYLDKNKFDVSIFSLTQINKHDTSQNQLRELPDHWFDLYENNNQKIADQIQNEKIDILVDLIGFTKPERLELFNSRIAPLQISWLSYCNTTGLDNIDYLISDKNLILPGEEGMYSEKIVKLPQIWNTHSGFEYERKFNNLPFLKNNFFTFGSFNNFRKISDETIDAWTQILNKVPNSKLILKSSTFADKISLINKFKTKGVFNKIEVYDKLNFKNKEDHLNLYSKIDLCLDTFPYNGVTTSFEALWANIPVLVLKGFNFNSRCGESIIINSGFDFLLSNDVDDYISKAVYLSDNINVIEDLRKRIFETIHTTPLFNSKDFSNNFSNTLIDIYQNIN